MFKQTADARAPLARAARFFAGEIVAPDACMGIDHAERRFLAAKMQQNSHENGVLQNIGEIAGMECVAVIHGNFFENCLEF